MFDNKQFIIILFLLLILLIINRYYIENLSVDQGYNNLNIGINNTKNKWLNKPVANNSTNIENYPINNNYFYTFPSTFYPYIGSELFNILINKFNDKYSDIIFIEEDPNVIKYFEVTTDKYNLKTWKNKMDWDPDSNKIIEYKKSDIFEINYFNKFFIINLNNILKNEIKNNILFKKLNDFTFFPYFIFKYKLLSYLLNPDEKKFELEIQLLTKYSIISPLVYCDIIFNKNNMYINKIEVIGFNNTSDLLIRNNNKEKYFNTINSFDNQGIPRNIDKLLNKKKKELDKNKLESQFACFNKDNNIIRTNNKLDCENTITWYGDKKDSGVWDRPCKKNSECPFFKSNKNYDNNFGKCLSNGYCQMPKDAKKIGYHLHLENDNNMKCYNCNSKKWNSITTLGDCCEDQKNKVKYPFLDSPDYAFDNDVNNRVNAFKDNKNIGFFKDYKVYYNYIPFIGNFDTIFKLYQ